MLESRAAYGWYGENGTATGETAPTTHASGWNINSYHFKTKGCGNFDIVVRAKSYENAMKAAKKWGKKDGFEIIGDADGYENQKNWWG